MNWSKWVRQIHRWLSMAFALAVLANIAVLGQEQLGLWVGLFTLLPLALLLLTGLYHVRASARHQVARATRRRTGVNVVAGKTSRKSVAASEAGARQAAVTPVLLSGGNPQIAKGYGDAPVQAYIAAMPGWKSDVGRRLDALIERTVPGVQKAVKWNSPFYGIEGDGWFLSFHCFTKYIKVAFFRGASLRPCPPGESKHKEVRYLDIYEDELDEAQFVDWVKQASELPGERM